MGDAVAQMVKSERNGGFSSSINWQRLHRILGAGGDKSQQNRMNTMLGGHTAEVVLQIRRELAGKQQPDTTIEMQLCSSGQIRPKQFSFNG